MLKCWSSDFCFYSRELDAWPQEEELQHQENNRIQDCHKGRNNNSNNNAQEKMLSVWDAINPSLGINMQPCRYELITQI